MARTVSYETIEAAQQAMNFIHVRNFPTALTTNPNDLGQGRSANPEKFPPVFYRRVYPFRYAGTPR